ncbi:MAG: family 43 glycosylhydrolase, partial [Lachnospiraceae bacterium]|nr:family 43 glycosylhydrolase [Lachnospiraceae bacterium]
MSEKEFTKITYPTVYSDIPDLDIIRRGDTFYMVSTTMNLCPGVPIMKSADLAHWQIV